MENLNLITIFLTGLFTSSLSCMAVQGGLLTATLVNQEEENLIKKTKNANNIIPIIAFLISKLLAYTLFGFLLGTIGSAFNFSITAKVVMQIIVAVFMFGTAGNLLKIHPLFRYFSLQPPKFIFRLIKKQSKNKNLFAPIITGAFTVFIPCGITQSIMALSISSGNPLYGSAIMFSFILGTSPVFFILGYLTTKLEENLHEKFLKFAGFILIILGILNINSVLILSGSNLNLSHFWKNISCSTILVCDNPKTSGNILKNEITITINRNSYTPNVIEVKKDTKITLHIKNENGYGCIQSFTIPKLNYQKVIPPGSSDTITFQTPNSKTDIIFTCSMGMYVGVIKVK